MVDFAENFSQYGASKLPTFRDNFTYGTQTEADTAWVSSSNTELRVNIANDNIFFDPNTGVASDQTIKFDLGTNIASGSAWTLRFKLDVQTFIQGASSTNLNFFLGLSDTTGFSQTVQDFLGIAGIIDTGGINEYRLHDIDGAFLSTASDTTFTHDISVETLYVEIKRTSRTRYEASFYSDAKYTDIIEEHKGTCNSTIDDLRFIKFVTRSAGSNDHNIEGVIDDVEFWIDEKEATVTDNFIVDNWDDSGTLNQVNTGTQVLDWDFSADSTPHKTVLDLGDGGVSDERWILRWKQITDDVSGSGNTSDGYIGMWDSDETVVLTPTSQQFIGLECFTNGTNGGQCRFKQNFSGTPVGGVGEYQFLEINVVGTAYWEIKRLSSTTMIASVYSDANFTQLIDTSGIVPCSASIVGLRYIGVGTINSITSGANHDGTIDDVQFWNGITEIPTSQEGLPVNGAVSIEEKFELETTQLTDDFTADNWVDSGTQILVNTGAEVIDWDTPNNVTHHATTFDLTEVSDIEWTLRFKLDISNLTQGASANNTLLYVDLTDADETQDSSVSNDFIGLTLRLNNANNEIYIADGTAITRESVFGDTAFSHALAVETLYVQIKRTSATSYKINLFSDATYTTLIETLTGTCDASNGGHRYIKVFTNSNGDTTSHTLDGTIDDVQFWNGESLLSRWNVNATEGALDTVNSRINWTMLRNGTDNRVVRDLGTAVSDENWVLRFKYHINAGGVQATTSGANYQVLLQDTDVGQSSTNDTIGWSMQSTAGVAGRTFVLLGRESGSTSGFATTADAIIPYAGAVDLYVEMKRISPTIVEARVYNDPFYTDLLVGSELSIVTSSLNIGHKFLVCSSGDVSNPWDGTETGYIDCIELYDCSGVARAVIETTEPEFEDSFWEDNWFDTGSNITVNTTTRVIDWDGKRDSTNHATSIDVGIPINDSKWALRGKIHFDTITAGTVFEHLFIALSTSTSGIASNVAQDHISLIFSIETGGNATAGINSGTDVLDEVANVSFANNLYSAGDDLYFELKRVSTTEYEASLYSDPDFTNLLGTVTGTDLTGAVTGLEHIKIQNSATVGGSGAFDGTIDNLQLWDGNLATEHQSKWKEVNE